MRLKGLTGSGEHNNEEYMAKAPPENKVPQKKRHAESALNLPNPLKIYNPDAKTESSSMTPVTLVSTDVQQLDEEVKAMMGTSENMLTVGNETQRARICKVCGKEGQMMAIMNHIESNQIPPTQIQFSHSSETSPFGRGENNTHARETKIN